MRACLLFPFVLAGCESELCALLGEYQGGFEGDAEGAVVLVVEEDPENPGQATAGMTLDAEDGSLQGDGSGIVTCSSGELTVDLRDGLTGAEIGEATGTLAGDGGGGDWSLLSGESGTWTVQ